MIHFEAFYQKRKGKEIIKKKNNEEMSLQQIILLNKYLDNKFTKALPPTYFIKFESIKIEL